MYNLDFFDDCLKLGLRYWTKVKIEIYFREFFDNSFQEAIDSLEKLRNSFIKFDEIKELKYYITLKTDFTNEILNEI